MNEDNSIFFWLNVVANLLQIENYNLLLKDSSNNDLMKELQYQDRILEKQTNEYLETIIKQNEEILKKFDNK